MQKAEKSKADTVVELLKHNKIATLDQLKEQLRTNSTMTVFRTLKKLEYLTSYSHRGKYYTLNSIADFDVIGLWSINSVWFSKYGNLIETIWEFVEQSKAGFSTRELALILNVEVKHCLLQLFQRKRIHREKIGARLLYFSMQPEKQKQQRLLRESGDLGAEFDTAYEVDIFRDELKAAIIFFYSLLNEKQRRLYAGLESFKLGHGGDRKVSELLGLTPHTAAKGRRELLGGNILTQGVRKKGGGRKTTGKKSRR